jgi:hypothetical protein
MKNQYRLIILLMILGNYLLADDSLDNLKNTAKGVGDQFKAFGTGLAESFGMNPPGYHYSFRMFNNTNSVVAAEARRIKTYQGIFIRQDSIEEWSLKPTEESGPTRFKSINLYLEVVAHANGSKIFSNSIVDQMADYKTSTPAVVFYNIYESAAGLHGESLGTSKTTNGEFLGSIYNTLQKTQTMTFLFADQTFTIALDPQSYNFLSSNNKIANSIRPSQGVRTFDFGAAGKIYVSAQGLATGQLKDGTMQNVQADLYHYEIIGTETAPRAITAGFNPGSFSQPLTQRLRTITPIACLIWNKSPDQIIAENDFVAVTLPNSTTWVAYSTPSWSNKTLSITDTVIAKIPEGKALLFYGIRPLIDTQNYLTSDEMIKLQNLQPTKTFGTETTLQTLGVNLAPVDLFKSIKDQAPKTAKAPLYIVSIDTIDDTKAKAFLQNLLQGKIPLPVAPSLESKTLLQDVNQSLVDKLSTTLGQLKDPVSGITGYLLVYDSFTPYGNGNGPYFYTLEPALKLVAPIFTELAPFINKSLYDTDEGAKAVKATIAQWITIASNQPDKITAIKSVYDLVLTYLTTNGVDGIFMKAPDGSIDKTKLSWMGNMGLNKVVSGPTGVINAPVQYKSGMNHSVYSGAAVPSMLDPVTKKEIGWNPSQVIDVKGNQVQNLPY